jgi:hypothetical protein
MNRAPHNRIASITALTIMLIIFGENQESVGLVESLRANGSCLGGGVSLVAWDASLD